MSDLISRQALLDSFRKCYVGHMGMEQSDAMMMFRSICKVINEQPSAQPEQKPEQPESARDYCAECDHIEMCRWYPYEGCEFRSLPSAEPEIIYCKDCRKYNIGIGDFEETEQGRHWYWKDEACPLVSYRGKAQGHEFDYQYCIFGKRRTDAET